MPSPLYNRAELRYNKRNRGEECRLKTAHNPCKKAQKRILSIVIQYVIIDHA